jgi:predicted O-methyltransferase YrrM
MRITPTFVLNRLRQLAVTVRAAITPDANDTFTVFELLDASRRAKIPRIQLADLLKLLAKDKQIDRVQLRASPRGNASGSTAEMVALSSMTAAMKPKQILEFGTFDGASAWHLLNNASSDCSLTTIDLPAGKKVEGSSDVIFQGEAGSREYLPDDPRVRLVEVDSRHWEPDVANVDLCFIDAGHSYECVKSDTEKAFKIMRPGGLVVWHDAVWRRDGYEVNRYLRELRAQGRDVRLVRVSPFDYCGLAVLLV